MAYPIDRLKWFSLAMKGKCQEPPSGDQKFQSFKGLQRRVFDALIVYRTRPPVSVVILTTNYPSFQ